MITHEKCLEKELEFYKRLVSKIQFEIYYSDTELQMELYKKRGQAEPIINSKCIAEDQLIYDISLEEDVAFEKVEKFIEPILDSIPHHISFINEDGIVTLCNKQIAKDYDKEKDEIIGYHIRDLLNIPDEHIMSLQTLKSNENINNKEILDKNYGIFTGEIINSLNGKRVVGVFQFLNAIKDAEKKGLAGRIAAGIAHEIRNPLTTVKGFLQLYRDRVDGDLAKVFGDVLIPEINRANNIITDFLNLAKPAPIKKEKININDFIKNHLMGLFHSEIMLKDINLNYQTYKLFNSQSIFGNKEELTQVFMNLFKNAIDATPPGKQLELTVRGKIVCDRLKITFKDNGTGICPTAIDCIFDPFFTTKDDGTGLGLSVSRKIIESHGGIMNVESDNTGTTFIVEFPILEEDE